MKQLWALRNYELIAVQPARDFTAGLVRDREEELTRKVHDWFVSRAVGWSQKKTRVKNVAGASIEVFYSNTDKAATKVSAKTQTGSAG